jgi:hypothetical protein
MAAAKGNGAPKKATIKPAAGSGQKPITFKPGGLHASLGVPKGQPIPPGKMQGALNGDYGPKAASQARFAKNVLTGGSKPATPGKKKGTTRGK